jgi:hypothetical protein
MHRKRQLRLYVASSRKIRRKGFQDIRGTEKRNFLKPSPFTRILIYILASAKPLDFLKIDRCSK